MKKLTNKKGFTLVELLVVVAIIAVLMLLALPRFMDSTKGAKIKTFESNYRSILSAISQYSALNSGSYNGIEADTTEPQKLTKSLAGKPKGSNYELTKTTLTGTLPKNEIGLEGTDAAYTIEYTFSTDTYVVTNATGIDDKELAFKSSK